MTTQQHERIKFDGKNWPIYKRKIRAVLLQLEVLDTIDVPAMKEKDSSSSAQHLDTKRAESDVKKSNKAYSVLMLSLDDARTQMVMHIAEGDAAGVWRTLCSHYESSSMASKSHTRSMLHKMKMNSEEEFDLYIVKSRILELKMRLEAMGEKVTDGELIFIILEGLPEEYSALKQSLFVQDEFGLEKICGHIRDHQEKQAYRGKVEEELDTAMFSRQQKIRRQGGSKKSSTSTRFDDSDDDTEDRTSQWPFVCVRRSVIHLPCVRVARVRVGSIVSSVVSRIDARLSGVSSSRRGGTLRGRSG